MCPHQAAAQREHAAQAAKAVAAAGEEAARALEDRDSALSEVGGLQDVASTAQAKLVVMSEELQALKLETGSLQVRHAALGGSLA
jgi:hypothetical protein